MDDHKRVAVLQASLGGIDNYVEHVHQSIEHDHFLFTDKNFPPRNKAMTPRLQAKIPKMFGYQMAPGYDYYLWLDGNISLNHKDTLKYFLEQIEGNDIVVLRHYRRPDIRQENRYLRKGLREQSRYLVARYDGELLKEQIGEIDADKDFKDDLLVIGGIYMYRNTPKVQQMFKEWWYHVSRYIIQDQLSFPYVLKKSGIKVKVLDHDYTKWDLIKHVGHKIR